MTSREVRERLTEITQDLPVETRTKVEKFFYELRRENQALQARVEQETRERDGARQAANRASEGEARFKTQLERAQQLLVNMPGHLQRLLSGKQAASDKDSLTGKILDLLRQEPDRILYMEDQLRQLETTEADNSECVQTLKGFREHMIFLKEILEALRAALMKPKAFLESIEEQVRPCERLAEHFTIVLNETAQRLNVPGWVPVPVHQWQPLGIEDNGCHCLLAGSLVRDEIVSPTRHTKVTVWAGALKGGQQKVDWQPDGTTLTGGWLGLGLPTMAGDPKCPCLHAYAVGEPFRAEGALRGSPQVQLAAALSGSIKYEPEG